MITLLSGIFRKILDADYGSPINQSTSKSHFYSKKINAKEEEHGN
jgi:hypothetical protein